jgi:hypothetical protein
MSEKSTSFQIGYYIDLALRHRWLIIAPFCLAMIVGIYLALTLPKDIHGKYNDSGGTPGSAIEIRSIHRNDRHRFTRINSTIQQQITSRYQPGKSSSNKIESLLRPWLQKTSSWRR